ncbi:MAG: hypothetical protein QM655_11600 [Nocardioidaceae bacterium]
MTTSTTHPRAKERRRSAARPLIIGSLIILVVGGVACGAVHYQRERARRAKAQVLIERLEGSKPGQRLLNPGMPAE